MFEKIFKFNRMHSFFLDSLYILIFYSGQFSSKKIFQTNLSLSKLSITTMLDECLDSAINFKIYQYLTSFHQTQSTQM
jgi:hypothetical protein